MKESEQRKKEDMELKLEPKPKLELNRWIVCDGVDNWMIYLNGDGFDFYGVDSNGEWMYNFIDLKRNSKTIQNYNDNSLYRYATDEEILDRLSKVAVKMGYKERQSECLSDVAGREEVNLSDSVFELDSDGCLWIIEHALKPYRRSNEIFSKGKWADFIETDAEKIERLEKEVKELKNKTK